MGLAVPGPGPTLGLGSGAGSCPHRPGPVSQAPTGELGALTASGPKSPCRGSRVDLKLRVTRPINIPSRPRSPVTLVAAFWTSVRVNKTHKQRDAWPAGRKDARS